MYTLYENDDNEKDHRTSECPSPRTTIKSMGKWSKLHPVLLAEPGPSTTDQRKTNTIQNSRGIFLKSEEKCWKVEKEVEVSQYAMSWTGTSRNH